MRKKTRKYPVFSDPEIQLSNIEAHKLYEKISNQHGKSIADQIFANVGKPPSANWSKFSQRLELADRLLLMPEGPNVYKLIQEIIAENKAAGRGSTNEDTIKKQVKRAVEAAQEFMRDRRLSLLVVTGEVAGLVRSGAPADNLRDKT